MTTVNWNNIRAHSGSQEQGFEELCCQLFYAEYRTRNGVYERRGKRDAGLECAFTLEDGRTHGLQAKFFLTSPSDSQWAQIDNSVRVAIEKNPTLVKLVICVPQNFDDPKIPGQNSAMSRWHSLRLNWTKCPLDARRSIEFELWDDSALTTKLISPQSEGRRWYFFNELELTRDWFKRRIDESEKNAGPRYTETLNVKLPIADRFESLCRTPQSLREPKRLIHQLTSEVANTSPIDNYPSTTKNWQALLRLSERLKGLQRLFDAEDFAPIPFGELVDISAGIRSNCSDLTAAIDEAVRARSFERKPVSGAASDDSVYEQSLGDLTRKLRGIASLAYDLGLFADSDAAKSANNPQMLVVGDAGTGKTHLFIDVSKDRCSRNLPTIVILGERFREGDVWLQITEMLGLHITQDQFLQALESAAQSQKCRLLLLIDALNEGPGSSVWSKQLAGFLTAIKNHPWIAIAVSVRSTYLANVIPESVLPNMIQVRHVGFGAKAEAAARAFFAYYDISLPSIPLISPEYGNPLFLKLLCKGLNSAGYHDLPEGQLGIDRVFDLFVDGVEEKLRREQKIDAPPGLRIVADFLGQFADAIARTSDDSLSFEEATSIIAKGEYAAGYEASLLSILIREGVLTQETIRTFSGTDTFKVRFAYQRFGDHMIASRLLDQHCGPSNSTAPFNATGYFGKIVWDFFSLYRRQGLLVALSVQVPVRFGRELYDILDLPDANSNGVYVRAEIGRCLIESLYWRTKDSITPATFAILNDTFVGTTEYWRYLELLLAFAPVPGHPLNAIRLHSLLKDLPMAERDSFAEEWLHHYNEAEGGGGRLIDWALTARDLSRLSPDATYLAAIAIAWFTASTIRRLRDRATKALVCLLTTKPELIKRLLSDFSIVDDHYVIERIYAAAYGVAMRLPDNQQLVQLAEAVFERLFSKRPVVSHIMIRDYGRSVVETAAARGGILSFDANLARPPYGSAVPQIPPSRESFLAMLPPLSKGWTDEDRALSHVVNRFGELDHSRYHGGPSLRVNKITSISIFERAPQTRRQRIRDMSLSETQKTAWGLVTGLKEQAGIRLHEALASITADELQQISDDLTGLAAYPEVESAFEAHGAYSDSLDEFTASLTSEQARIFETDVSSVQKDPVKELPAFDAELFVRYVIARTLELGWSVDQFGQFDSSVNGWIDRGGTGLARESIGSKYLWISYYQTLAWVVDNFQIYDHGDHDAAKRYDGAWELGLRNIDPSCVPTAKSGANSATLVWPTISYDISVLPEARSTWLRRSEDLPHIPDLLKIKDAAGSEWIVLEAGANFDEPTHRSDYWDPLPRRRLWMDFRGYFVSVESSDAVFQWMKSQDFMGRWMPEASESYGVFLGEFYDSPAWRDFAFGDDWQFEDLSRPEGGCPSDIATAVHMYGQSDEDKSVDEVERILMPSPLLKAQASLRWTGEPREWAGSNGKVVVRSLEPSKNNQKCLVIHREFLEEFLAERKYALVWTILGEKQILDGIGRGPRLEITGAGVLLNGVPNVWHRSQFKD